MIPRSADCRTATASTTCGAVASNSRAGDPNRSPVSASADISLLPPVVAEGNKPVRLFELRDCHRGDTLDPFLNGRYSDDCERGRAANAALAARSELAEGKLGLVRAAYLTVYPDSRLIELQLPMACEATPPTVGRGKINGFSDESRRRLMILLHSFKRTLATGAFVTLTFPDDAVPTAREAKRLLQTFLKRWRRRYPQLCAIWRVEAHPERSAARGEAVPHIHLLAWGCWIDREQLSLDWAQVVNAPDFLAHLAAGTSIETLRSFRGVLYNAKRYISKAEEYSLGEDCGRIWGIFNREALPVGESVTVKLSTAQTVQLVRHVRRLLFSRGVKCEYMPRSIYLERPGDIMRLLE